MKIYVVQCRRNGTQNRANLKKCAKIKTLTYLICRSYECDNVGSDSPLNGFHFLKANLLVSAHFPIMWILSHDVTHKISHAFSIYRNVSNDSEKT